MRAVREHPGGLSCGNCPFKEAVREAGLRWTRHHERRYCHGGIPERRKAPEDGCAVLWPTWGAVAYYGEMMTLIGKGMPPPAHWTLADWRLGYAIGRRLEDLAYDDAREGGT